MSFWSQWSDGKKWVMGIVSALLVFVLTAVLSRNFAPPAAAPSAATPTPGQPNGPPSPHELQAIPGADVQRLEAASGLGTPGDSDALWLKVNNATTWTLTAISIRFQFIDPWGRLAWDRMITMSLAEGSSGKPFEISEFSNPNGRLGKPTNGFGYNVKLVGIVAAYGRKP